MGVPVEVKWSKGADVSFWLPTLRKKRHSKMTGRTVQIASFDAAACKLKLHKTELDSILNQPHLNGLFIAVYSFIGAYNKTGKSSNLNILKRFLRSNIDLNSSDWLAQLNDNDDPLSSGSKSETQSIWAWSEVFVVDGPDGQKVGLLLMDTHQGLSDKTNTDQSDGQNFALFNLLNSDQTLSTQSIFQATTTIHNSSVARNAVKEYRTSIIIAVEESNAADTFLSVANMKLKHGGFYRKALDFFAQHQMGDAGPNSPILDKLKKDLDNEFKNWRKRNELIQKQKVAKEEEEALQRYQEILNAPIEKIIEDLEKASVAIRHYFL